MPLTLRQLADLLGAIADRYTARTTPTRLPEAPDILAYDVQLALHLARRYPAIVAELHLTHGAPLLGTRCRT